MLFSFLLLLSCRCTEPSSPFLLPLKHQHHHHHQSPLITATAPIVRRQTHTLNSVTQPPPRALANSIYRRTHCSAVGIQNIYFCNPPPLTQRPSKRGIIIKLWGRCHCLPACRLLFACNGAELQSVSELNQQSRSGGTTTMKCLIHIYWHRQSEWSPESPQHFYFHSLRHPPKFRHKILPVLRQV